MCGCVLGEGEGLGEWVGGWRVRRRVGREEGGRVVGEEWDVKLRTFKWELGVARPCCRQLPIFIKIRFFSFQVWRRELLRDPGAGCQVGTQEQWRPQSRTRWSLSGQWTHVFGLCVFVCVFVCVCVVGGLE